MNRRDVALPCFVVILLAASCVDGPSLEETDFPPAIQADDLALERGERGPSIPLGERQRNAVPRPFRHVAGSLAKALVVSLDSGDVTFDPGGVLQADSDPPIPHWNDVERDVTGIVPVRVGEYATIARPRSRVDDTALPVVRSTEADRLSSNAGRAATGAEIGRGSAWWARLWTPTRLRRTERSPGD